MVKSIFVLSMFLMLFSCHESFNFVKRNYKGKDLNLNGYYYSLENNYTEIFFLYNNGIIYRAGSGKLDVGDIDKGVLLNVKKFLYTKPDIITNWGTYYIDNQSIYYDMRYSRADAPVYRRKGDILNDSTFIIKSVSRPNGKEFKEENRIYHFRTFSPKPDSTNNFIK
jgi:hypothetical protein